MRVYEAEKVNRVFCGLIDALKNDSDPANMKAASAVELIQRVVMNQVPIMEAEPVCLENRTFKHYDPDISYGTHTVRVTFMLYDYVGHITYQVGGNCKGGDLLNTDFLEEHSQEDIENYVENDCSFAFDEDYEIYSLSLTNPSGDRLEADGEACVIKDMVVKVEIVDFIARDATEVG